MYPHRIRLVGPWEYEVLSWVAGAESSKPRLPDRGFEDSAPATQRERVTMPCRWRDCGLGDFTGTVRFTRRFGYPGRIDEYERVWLTFAAVAGHAAVCLNGTDLGQSEGPCEFEATRLLRERNVLHVDIEVDSCESGLCGEVALEVRRTAFLRNVRVTATDSLHISGEVAGTAAGPLELYVICERRNIGYAAVEAGKPFHVEAEKIEGHIVRIDLVHGASIWWTEEKQID
jgi:hypothetical protein